jgi:DNA polymerase/3'-5' exonuclease PolX
MAETNKQKRPYAAVLQVANYIVERLAPACERVEIAGSLRRKKAEVGDIEIVAVPKLNYDLLGEPMKQTQVDDALMGLAMRKNGEKYKQFDLTEGLDLYQVDLFLQPDPATWGVNFMIRTGSAEFSKRMVTPKKFGGLMPNDLRVQDARVWRGHECLATPEEGDLFRLWGMTFVAPEARV